MRALSTRPSLQWTSTGAAKDCPSFHAVKEDEDEHAMSRGVPLRDMRFIIHISMAT